MLFTLKNIKISQILTIIPSNPIRFEDEIEQYNFPTNRTLKMKEVIGCKEHRIAPDGVIASDLALKGLKYLIDTGKLNKDSIGGLVFVSLSPDYVLPPTSFVLHGKLGLKKDVVCVDIPQGCAGFLMGLIQASMMINTLSLKRVVVINAETLSTKISRKDRNSWPIGGDAASITIVEAGGSNIYTSLYTDGSQYDAIIIPAGGFRMPSTAETAKMQKLGDGNERALDHCAMKGIDVFNFVQTVVPMEIQKAMDYANVTDDEIFSYCFHQPNRFMLEKLADKIGVNYNKIPANIVENFGNSSGVTIPMVITYNFADIFKNDEKLICCSGFGMGLNCITMIMKLGNLDLCKMMEY